MVLIVKLPARNASQRPSDAPGSPVEGAQDPVMSSGTGSAPNQHNELAPPISMAGMTLVSDVFSKDNYAQQEELPATPEMAPKVEHEDYPSRSLEEPSVQPRAQTQLQPSTQPALDVLLAPSVLQHRYVRGVDKSNIVERPERIRAVLLGISGVMGLEQNSTKTSKSESPDDLAALFSGMNMNRGSLSQTSALSVYSCQRSLPLDTSCKALAYVHGHDLASYGTETEYHPSTESCGPTHLERLVKLSEQAPYAAPDQFRHRGASTSDDSSSDGEGDSRMHPSEIPHNLPQGDLYLCGPHATGTQDTHNGGSYEAISHALGASIEAVDRVVAGSLAVPHENQDVQAIYTQNQDTKNSPERLEAPSIPARRAFVLTRPPGHHCNGADPQGFCWVNNAIVAAAHAHAEHQIDRVIVLDIDLHHGNGTQGLAWRINAEAQKRDTDRAARLATHRRANRARKQDRTETYEKLLEEDAIAGPRSLRICYTSLHDIESFPCEDGDPDLIRDASVCINGAHGQWIWNVHLETHRNDTEFERLYSSKYTALFDKARDFVKNTHAYAPRTLVMISCGFDACVHEYPGMQRHGKFVPAWFYARFAKDAAKLADEVADGKLISLLEGGYSDRALVSGALAHTSGLANLDWEALQQQPWTLDNIAQLEKMGKKVNASANSPSRATPSLSVSKRRTMQHAAWVVKASEHFASFMQQCGHKAEPIDIAMSAPATPRGTGRGMRRGLEDAGTPTFTSAGGHSLRDRSVIKSRSQANLLAENTPIQSRIRPPIPSRTQAMESNMPPPSPMPKRNTPSQTGTAHAMPPTPSSLERQIDPSNFVPGALPVESAPNTPMKPIAK
ncbi:histone deacetylase [Malassezia yamatoensis]|uniref:Histone deacetylase n=1 Tax=Malassezia yamatoensis TaxID=253288 RepID=A0AAJ5YTZ9_9BASI|nr:histone deacetylase [Malassezia yamatoensis]